MGRQHLQVVHVTENSACVAGIWSLWDISLTSGLALEWGLKSALLLPAVLMLRCAACVCYVPTVT